MRRKNKVVSCVRCGHDWIRIANDPQKCPKCNYRRYTYDTTLKEFALRKKVA